MSTIGSQISLWLGMSIISGYEILEYIILLSMALIRGKESKVDKKGTGNN